MTNPTLAPRFEPPLRASIADGVFAELQRQLLSLDLEPGSKLSEAEIARAMGVSRQPVRDAFYRLAKLGFLQILPQRATTVTLISTGAVMRAQAIRTALEAETVRVAASVLAPADFDVLETLLAEQDAAIAAADRPRFHRLDDLFHREICERAGLGHFWDLIAENKGHMDRVRMLSLAFASRHAWDDHVRIVAALKAHDPEAACAALRAHLSRILGQIERIRADNLAWFADEPAPPDL
ncbi:GntR family transcriptional regulator [Rhodovulum sulfidophilum]|uniref:GntR family transcriptional regulator n=1 Tax=Rhodovulum visakhapatnamense TaxID=364297 RepID=A0ABS1RED3_9RHOB|nr:GntR family transcriptional regulator [Rhodovulum visakhapatnamense]MBL3570084.1 GntR family transcriptional regulator [Rhodovulum visakhapatnamense]MBL3577978.1 GntR family transcriptional regulator [Rhodovulum visakhapatnamense]OLS46450.1 GntR family transcriptional regulator [Rhodovulum sulfidophilum]